MNLINTPKAATSNPLPVEIERLVDRIFEQLLASCPSIQYWSEKQIATAKQQWILGFAENSIRTIEQVRLGMRELRAKTDDFVPSVGKFIAWCQGGTLQAQGMPSLERLLEQVGQYARFFGTDFEEGFVCASEVEYDLVFRLYCQNKRFQWSNEDLCKAAKKALKETAERMANGTYQPVASRALPEKASFIDPVQQREINLEGVAMCKSVFRGQD